MPGIRKYRPGGSGADPTAWMVTFTDCMTLMLTFFVLMVTFSSYDENALHQIGGAFENHAFRWIFLDEEEVRESVAPPAERLFDRTAEGSEKPTESELEMVRFSRPPQEALSAEAYRDRQTFYLPSDRLFYARGWTLRPDGAQALLRIAAFMKLVPCQVIVGEMSDEPAGAASLERAWAVVNYLVDKSGLPEGRFGLSAGGQAPPGWPPGQPVVRIDLLVRSPYE
jgi:chemotaxis protein MotB